MPLLLLALGLMGLILAGGVLTHAGTRPAGVLPSAQRRIRVEARQFANFSRSAQDQYEGGVTPPSPCYAVPALGLAPGFTLPVSWGCLQQNTSSQNLFWTYGALPAPTLAALLSMPQGAMFGVDQNGTATISIPGAGPTRIAVPASIPSGDTVAVLGFSAPPFNWNTLNGQSAYGSFIFSGSYYNSGCFFCFSTTTGYMEAQFSASVSGGTPFVAAQIVQVQTFCAKGSSCSTSSNPVASGSGTFAVGPLSAADSSGAFMLTADASPQGLTGSGAQSDAAPQNDFVPWS